MSQRAKDVIALIVFASAVAGSWAGLVFFWMQQNHLEPR